MQDSEVAVDGRTAMCRLQIGYQQDLDKAGFPDQVRVRVDLCLVLLDSGGDETMWKRLVVSNSEIAL
jgi:hypothetical protein